MTTKEKIATASSSKNILQDIIEKKVKRIKVIPYRTRFWLNLANNNDDYDTFKMRGIIGLNEDVVNTQHLNDIKSRYTRGRTRRLPLVSMTNTIYRIVKENSQELDNIKGNKGQRVERTKLFNKALQISEFAYRAKPGDFVVVPSEGFKTVLIGQVKFDDLDEPEYFHLQRRVAWIDEIPLALLDINFYKFFETQQQFRNIDNYDNVVLKTLYDFYVYKKNAHLVLNIDTRKSISAMDEAEFNFLLLVLLEDFLYEHDLPYSVKNIRTVVNLNSPGKRSFFGRPEVIILGAILIIAILGGGVKAKDGELDMSTKGLVNSVNDYLNEKKRREIADKILSNSDSLSIDERKLYLEIMEQLKTDKK